MSQQTDSIISKANEIAALAQSISTHVPPGGGGSPSWPAPLNCLPGSIAPPGMVAEPTAHWHYRRAYFQRMQTNVPDGAVLFHGDSITEAMAVSGASPYAVNMGIGGQDMRQLLNLINDNGSVNPIHRAGAVVVSIGVNDLGSSHYPSKENAADTVVWIWENLLAPAMGGKWVVCKILPVDTSLNPSVLNSQIVTVNSYLQTKFQNNPNVRLVDVNATLAPSGVLLSQYHIGDGLHLSGAGYSIWRNAIKAALESLISL